MIKVLLNGSGGKMAQAIAQIIAGNPAYGLQVVAERGEDGQIVGAADFDMIIDFSLPPGAQAAFDIARERKAAFLTGTTNLPDDFMAAMRAEKNIPVFYAPNVSIGVYLFTKLIKEANKLFAPYQKTMHEVHHSQKKDAPSGTAKSLAAAASFPVEEITYERIGSDPGTHSVAFTSAAGDEEIKLTHRVLQRTMLARSAVAVAAWLAAQKPGFYDMQDFAQGGER